jgi:hypothetical protein
MSKRVFPFAELFSSVSSDTDNRKNNINKMIFFKETSKIRV